MSLPERAVSLFIVFQLVCLSVDAFKPLDDLTQPPPPSNPVGFLASILRTGRVSAKRSGDEVTDVSTNRCSWVSINDPLMLEYHDREWGVPVHEDRKHFEFLVLEAAQAGLSWAIVLKKRDGYRRAFSQFDPEKVARYTEKRIQKLTSDPGIVRNRLKIAAAVRNARAFLAIQEEFGSFNDYCWRFVDGRPRLNRWKATRQIPATSPESDAFSKDLKARGFSFVGSTVMYAHMQAVGMVNDHLVDCFRYREIRRLV
jgi:DNA-3-methyladenine glycosylase I